MKLYRLYNYYDYNYVREKISRVLPAANDLTRLSSYIIILEYINITDVVTLALMLYKVPIHLDQALSHAYLANGSSFLNIYA